MSSEDERVVENLQSPRKRRRNEKNWKRNKAKVKRYSSEGKNPNRSCNHHGHRSYCRQEDLEPEDISEMFEEFYDDSDKQRQDTYLQSCIVLTPIKRKRVAVNQRKRKRQYNISYYVNDRDGNAHQICSTTFLSIFCVGADRVKGIAAHKWKTNNPRPERRGGARTRPGYPELREDIKAHISSFRCVASHYGRGKTPHKKYLPSQLCIKKMYELFLEQYDGPIQVKYHTYYGIFVSCFNLGFGNPRSDVCSVCTKLKVLIKSTNDLDRKRTLVTELLVHKTRARKFYTMLGEDQDESVLTVCFDLMANQALPKSAIGEAYYARQLWQYFLGIVVHRSGEQKREDVFFYTWGEHQQGRGANSVASALTHFFDQRLSAPNHGIKTVRLFSDSCVGQNKNFAVLTALQKLSNKHRVRIQHVFPVRGHSYMPADRAFGRVERIIRKQETIVLPQDYFESFRQVGQVIEYGVDWKVYGHKEASDTLLRKPYPFKITDAKILEVAPRSAMVKVKNFYSAEGSDYTLLKRGKTLNLCCAKEMPETNCVKPAKKRDILGLLEAMGQTENEEVMAFYNPICAAYDRMDTDDSDEEDEATVEINEDPW